MTSKQALSRREFLKAAGTGAAAVTATCVLAGPASSALASGPVSDNGWGMLIDVTRCTGCDSCALACKEANGRANPAVVPGALACKEANGRANPAVVPGALACTEANGRANPTVAPRALSSDAYTFIDLRPNAGSAEPLAVKRQCMHCQHPACVSACTVGALTKSADGPVVYDSKKCIGCRYCQYACPFGVPTYDWDNPLGLIHKCQMCVERLAEGEMPACVSSCPAGALRFGRRSDLLAQAHARISSNPGRYIDQVYGEFEAGGTSMLYLSGVPFTQLGLPELDGQSISHYAEAVMKKTPVVAASVAALATGLYWLTKRRDLHLSEAQVILPQEDRHDH
jgi:Fe-S-cluster-containing dehydrogenase component